MMQALQGIMVKIITMGLWYSETDELICFTSVLHFSPHSIYDSSFSMKTAEWKQIVLENSIIDFDDM